MNKEQEVIKLLEGYCEWCEAQGGDCQARLDGCSIFDAIVLLKQPEKPPTQTAIEFTKECRETELDEWSDWRIKEICDRLDKAEAEIVVLKEKLGAEGYRFREQKQINKELIAEYVKMKE